VPRTSGSFFLREFFLTGDFSADLGETFAFLVDFLAACGVSEEKFFIMMRSPRAIITTSAQIHSLEERKAWLGVVPQLLYITHHE